MPRNGVSKFHPQTPNSEPHSPDSIARILYEGMGCDTLDCVSALASCSHQAKQGRFAWHGWQGGRVIAPHLIHASLTRYGYLCQALLRTAHHAEAQEGGIAMCQ